MTFTAGICVNDETTLSVNRSQDKGVAGTAASQGRARLLAALRGEAAINDATDAVVSPPFPSASAGRGEASWRGPTRARGSSRRLGIYRYGITREQARHDEGAT